MAVAMTGLMAFAATSCSSDDDNTGGNGGGTEVPPTITGVSGNVEGTWLKGTTVTVTGHIIVPEGKSLTIEEGVNVIFTPGGVGVNHTPIEFEVKGNLYCKGTAENPVRLTVPEANRTVANIFQSEHIWGGIVAYESCAEMLIDNTIIEYTGGQVVEGSPAANAGVYTAGDDAYPQITTNNPKGNYVITNSVIRYGWSDGIYMMGGNAIIADNVFAGNGYDGAEAVNLKAGCKVDVAGNIMYNPNTNGLKLSSSGQDDNLRTQAKVCAYNNTIINAGWRRDGEKGGCVYAEKNVLANVFNNMMVNCKYRAQAAGLKTPNSTDGGFDTKSVIDYNCYVSGSAASDVVWAGETDDQGNITESGSGIRYAWEGYNSENKNYHISETTANDGTVVPAVDANSLIATEKNLIDPAFENYDINTGKMSRVDYDEAWDFHVKTVAAGAATGSEPFAKPYYAASALTVGGTAYSSPAVKAHYGAYGLK